MPKEIGAPVDEPGEMLAELRALSRTPRLVSGHRCPDQVEQELIGIFDAPLEQDLETGRVGRL